MAARTLLHHIQQLDPERDHLEIVRLSSCYEFPFDLTRALKLRARFIRLFLGDRRTPLRHAEKKHRSYPNGYRIEELGPQPAEPDAGRSSRP